MEIADKNVIITGGAAGIGKALAEKLAALDAHVAVFDIQQDGKNSFADIPNVDYYVCNITDFNVVKECVHDFFTKKGSIDILINNAGVIHNSLFAFVSEGKIATYDTGEWNKVINTNLNGAFHVTANVVPVMIEQRTNGLIINVSSISAAGNLGQSAYSAAKAGIDALTVVWAKEFAFYKIRVAGLAPGFTATERTLTSMGENVIADWKKKTPLRRMAAVDEMVEGFLFIIKNDFVNGRVIQIDGGLRI